MGKNSPTRTPFVDAKVLKSLGGLIDQATNVLVGRFPPEKVEARPIAKRLNRLVQQGIEGHNREILVPADLVRIMGFPGIGPGQGHIRQGLGDGIVRPAQAPHQPLEARQGLRDHALTLRVFPMVWFDDGLVQVLSHSVLNPLKIPYHETAVHDLHDSLHHTWI